MLGMKVDRMMLHKDNYLNFSKSVSMTTVFKETHVSIDGCNWTKVNPSEDVIKIFENSARNLVLTKKFVDHMISNYLDSDKDSH